MKSRKRFLGLFVLISSSLILLFSFQNCGTGFESDIDSFEDSSQPRDLSEGDDFVSSFAATGENAFNYGDLWKANANIGDGLNFNPLHKMDFNGDGKFDKVKCRDPYSNSKTITIYDGNSSRELYSYSLTRSRVVSGSTHKRRLGKCVLFEVEPGKPAVAIINFWEIPGWRTKANQVIVYRKKGKFVAKQVMVGSFAYQVSGRGGDCTKYPHKKLGGKAGSLCFFAGYEIGYRTHTAVLKLELDRNKNLVARDLTVTGNLQPWENGIHGTPLAGYHGSTNDDGTPRSKKCGGSSTWDGAFMMDGAWIDYDNNGLPDLITVGQHASIRSHRIRKDSSRRQGVKFLNSSILRAGQGVIQEWLRVTSLEPMNKSMRTNCVYLSGEFSGSRGCGGGMYDHIRCYVNKGTTRSPRYQWQRYNLPLVMSSEYTPPQVMIHKSGDLILKTRRWKGGSQVPIFYRLEAY